MVQVASISQRIWDMKYRLKHADGRPADKNIEDTWDRLATALSEPEIDSEAWRKIFYNALEDFKFLPAGRIVSGAGAKRKVTLFNCFVMGSVPDDMAGIFESLKEAALTMQQGGGIGYDFSTLRPKGALVSSVGADASGPLSFMDVWDAMCRTIMSAGSRRGAMMAVMRCDHPDIELFIEAKREAGRLRMFNLSVLVSDDFMRAVKDDSSWELTYDSTTYKSISARELWDKIMRATYAYAEPGVIFIDRINRLNPLNYCETIYATNPCGEQPLPPYGACLLGSLNLARLVNDPFTNKASIDQEELGVLVETTVRMMDNVIEISNFPLLEQEKEAKSKRRIGLGITGLADALIMCGVRYGATEAVNLTRQWMKVIQRAAYFSSAKLAAEKGVFPLYNKEKYLSSEAIMALDEDVRDAIAEHGVRNALLTSVAPTGTISLFADNVSSGIEPVFSFKYNRHVLMEDGTRREEEVSDYAYRLYHRLYGDGKSLTDSFVCAQELSPNDHLVMQATVQEYIDSSISKTINCPESISFDEFKGIYMQAFDLGCKGCTTYRPNDVTGSVLELSKEDKAADNEPELPFEKPTMSTTPADEGDAGPITHLYQPLDRPEELKGATYKVRWPESDHAMYITMSDIIDDSGRIRPFEIFIKSKNMDHYAWTVALTRMISAVFRRGGDVSFVVEELKAVFDPRGGHWMGGRYIPSLLAAIGEVIEKHMITVGFLKSSGSFNKDQAQARAVSISEGAMPDVDPAESSRIPPSVQGQPLRQCPKCGQPSLKKQEGCDSCISCDYSKCG
jgi:ribonucleoside-diphosphate reductase alpha chain